MQVLFWTSIIVCLYAYVGYPFLLWFEGLFFETKIGLDPKFVASVTAVLVARNEELHIEKKIENLASQQYPKGLLEVVVVSDGSTDATVDCASRSASKSRIPVRVIARASAEGKAAALAEGVREASGEIIVFADARQEFEPNAIRRLVSNFADPEVGAASGELRFRAFSNSAAVPMGLYWKYEKWIRKAESLTGSTVGATGAIYAVRRQLYRSLPHGVLLDDVLTPLWVAVQGYRVVFDSTATAYDAPSRDIRQEWGRKVRTLAGNWQLISVDPSLFVPSRNPLWWRLISHKFLRLIVPFVLPVLLVSGSLIDGGFYRFFTALQLVFYGLAGATRLSPTLRAARLPSLCHFFVVLNAAAVVGFWHFVRGDLEGLWPRGQDLEVGES